MSSTRCSYTRRGLVAAAAALLAVVPPVAVAARWTLNAVELDPGRCGRNLQLGSDRTASASATPTFLLTGDGGMSSYDVSIDGRRIGTFHSTPDGAVCIAATRPFAAGRHVLTATELAPHPDYAVKPLAFSVDTVPPSRPSRPVLSDFSDSGARGDGVTRFRSVSLRGTAAPNVSVQLFRNGTGVGGAVADARGRWSATTLSLPDGTYAITAVAIDSAGNKSSPSRAMRLTIDTTGRHGTRKPRYRVETCASVC